MDFSLLSPQDLQNFLTLSGVYQIPLNINLSEVEQAQQLFSQLENIPSFLSFPSSMPVTDLYIATNYKGPRDITHTYDQIMNLTLDEVQDFDQTFGFNASLSPDDLQTNRERIFRILDFLGLVIHEQEILLSPIVLQNLCSNLSLEDLNNFRIANNLETLTCQIPIKDKDEQIPYLNELNNPTFKLGREIEKIGSEQLFFEAYQKGHLETVRLLLENGIDPNLRNNHGWTGLMWASRYGRLEIVRLLLKNQANPNLENYRGQTALMWASENNNLEIVRLLLEYQAKSNHRNNYGYTALMLASENNNLEIVELLKQYGAQK